MIESRWYRRISPVFWGFEAKYLESHGLKCYDDYINNSENGLDECNSVKSVKI